MNRRHDARLVPAAIAAGGGAAAGLGGLSFVVLAAAVLAVVVTGALWVRRGGAAVALLVVVAATAGWISAMLHIGVAWGGGIGDALGSGSVEVRGRVVGDPVLADDSWSGRDQWRVELALESWTGAPHRRAPEGTGAHVVAVGELSALRNGDTAVLSGRLRPASGRAQALMWDAEERAAERIPATGVAAAAGRVRAALREAVSPLPTHVEGLLLGVVIGDTSRMPASQVEHLRISGLAHLTAVSGAHFAIVAVAVGAALRRMRAPRPVRIVVLVCVALAFTALVLPQPSVVRALGMALTAAIALAWGRPARALPALCATVIVWVLVDPWLVWSYGFVLSVAAVAGIVGLTGPLAASFQRWITPAAARAVAVPVAAQLATAPILVLLRPGVSALSAVANMAALPFVVPATLVGLLAATLAAPAPALGSAVAWAAGWCAAPLGWIASGVARAPGAWMSWPDSWAGAGLMVVACAAIALGLTARTVRGSWRVLGALIMAAVLAAVPAVRAGIGVVPGPPPDWQIVACDVGQGDMLVARASADSAVVIDTGPVDADAVGCLRRLGVEHVELLVLTHPHADHDGNATAVAREVGVERAWVAPVGADSGAARALEAMGVSVGVASRGDTFVVGQARVEVVLPEARAVSLLAGDSGLNDGSLVVHIATGAVTVLALGDLETDGQRTLLETLPREVVVDVVKVAHHGSGVQNEELASRIHARVAIVSVGQGNRYGHPAPHTLMLYGRSSALMRTDECGDIAVVRRGVLASDCRPDVAR